MLVMGNEGMLMRMHMLHNPILGDGDAGYLCSEKQVGTHKRAPLFSSIFRKSLRTKKKWNTAEHHVGIIF